MVRFRPRIVQRALNATPWVVLTLLMATVAVQARRLDYAQRSLVRVLGFVPSRGTGKGATPTIILVMQPRDCADAVAELDPIDSHLSRVVNIEAAFVDDDLSREQAEAIAAASGLESSLTVIRQRDALFVMNALSVRTTPFAVLIDSTGRIRRIFEPPQVVSEDVIRHSL
jgi:hypothetical protein